MSAPTFALGLIIGFFSWPVYFAVFSLLSSFADYLVRRRAPRPGGPDA